MTTRFRAHRIGQFWYCCELIPGGNPGNDAHWTPQTKCPSETAARDLAHTQNQWNSDGMYFEPFGAKPSTPAYV